MLIKHLIMIMGLSALLASCSTSRLGLDTKESTTDKGVRYLTGRGVPKDDAKAFSYFKQAADKGDTFAKNEVAYMYAVGKGTTKNYSKALEYYRQAAERGLASAQYNLGLMYVHGLGTKVDKQEAFKWVKKSAKHGFEPAKKALIST